MRSPSASVRLFVLVTGVLGIGLLLIMVPTRLQDAQSMATLLFFCALVLLADLNPVKLPKGAIVSVSTAINFSNTLVFGPFYATWAGALAVAAADGWLRRPWFKVLFNVACTSLSMGLGGLAFDAAYDHTRLPLGSLQNLTAVGIYALVNFVLNTLLLSTVIGLDQRLGPLQIWAANCRSSLFQFATMIPIGFLVANAYLEFSLWSALVLVLPLILTYNSLRSGQLLRGQTRSVMEALADVVDKRDPYTHRHSEQVAEYVTLIARRLRLPLEEQEAISAAARVHDLGKIAIRDAVLLKPGRLDPSECEEMQQHPVVGADILKPLAFYGSGRDFVRYHQERFDGRGYPHGLKGHDIPLGARIIAVADAYQAMTSDRPYRAALPHERAMSEILAGRGTQFDPLVVDAFLEAIAAERGAAARESVPIPGGAPA